MYVHTGILPGAPGNMHTCGCMFRFGSFFFFLLVLPPASRLCSPGALSGVSLGTESSTSSYLALAVFINVTQSRFTYVNSFKEKPSPMVLRMSSACGRRVVQEQSGRRFTHSQQPVREGKDLRRFEANEQDADIFFLLGIRWCFVVG